MYLKAVDREQEYKEGEYPNYAAGTLFVEGNEGKSDGGGLLVWAGIPDLVSCVSPSSIVLVFCFTNR